VIPTYNYGRYLPKAIESVLSQEDVNLELIIVDDGSTDDTIEILASYGDQILSFRQMNQGAQVARNLGLQKAKGEFICFLDSDDYFLPNSVRLRQQFLLRHPECDWVYSNWLISDLDGEVAGKGADLFNHGDLRWEGEIFSTLLKSRGGINLVGPMFRREQIVSIGGFDVSLKACQDYDLLLKASRGKNVAFLDIPLGVQRFHKSHISSRPELRYLAELSILKKYRSDQFAWQYLKDIYSPRVSNIYNYLVIIYMRKGERWAALKASVSSMLAKPVQGAAYRFLFYVLQGRRGPLERAMKNRVIDLIDRAQNKDDLRS